MLPTFQLCNTFPSADNVVYLATAVRETWKGRKKTRILLSVFLSHLDH